MNVELPAQYEGMIQYWMRPDGQGYSWKVEWAERPGGSGSASGANGTREEAVGAILKWIQAAQPWDTYE